MSWRKKKNSWWRRASTMVEKLRRSTKKAKSSKNSPKSKYLRSLRKIRKENENENLIINLICDIKSITFIIYK